MTKKWKWILGLGVIAVIVLAIVIYVPTKKTREVIFSFSNIRSETCTPEQLGGTEICWASVSESSEFTSVPSTRSLPSTSYFYLKGQDDAFFDIQRIHIRATADGKVLSDHIYGVEEGWDLGYGFYIDPEQEHTYQVGVTYITGPVGNSITSDSSILEMTA